MKTALASGLLALLIPLALSAAVTAEKPPVRTPPSALADASPRERLRLDAGWRFAFGHPTDPQKDFDHATGYFS